MADKVELLMGDEEGDIPMHEKGSKSLERSASERDTPNGQMATDLMPAMDPVTIGTGLLLIAMVVLPITGFILSRMNERDIQMLKENAFFYSALQCGSYDSDTGVFTLSRGGISFALPAEDDVQFLTGFDSPCVTCPAVAGALYGDPTPTDCANIIDGGGNTGIAERRAKDIGCSSETTFTSGVLAPATVANNVIVSAREIREPTNPGGTRSARCDSTDALPVAGSDIAHVPSPYISAAQARSEYFVPVSFAMRLCYCQPCGATSATSSNPAGAQTACSAFAAYSVGDSTEMCDYAPNGGWGISFYT